MAIDLINMAFKTPFKPTPKIILIGLCDNASDGGTCFPSLKTLCKKCSVGCSNLNYVLNAFESIMIIQRKKRKRENGSNTSTFYIINIPILSKIATSEDKEKYINLYEKAYSLQKNKKKPLSGQAPNHSVDKGKNHLVDKLIHPSGQLEPPGNHQSSKEDSSSENKESYVDFKKRIIDTYTGHDLVYGPKPFLPDTLITINSYGYLHNDISKKDLNREDGIAVWRWLFKNQERLIPINKEIV